MSEKEIPFALRREIKDWKDWLRRPRPHWESPKALEQEARYAPNPGQPK
jgi:hypothetical protein